MITFSATEARAKHSVALDHAANGEPVRITRRIGGDVVMISAAEYEAIQKARFDAEFDKIIGRHGSALKDLADK